MEKIIFASANHWTSPYQVGSHAWARLFAAGGWDVAYVSDPITPWHWLGRANLQRLQERAVLWKAGGIKSDGVFATVPFSLVAPQNGFFFRSRWILDHWHQGCIPSIRSRMERAGFSSPEVVWIDSVRHAGWTKQFRGAFTVYRMADLTSGFPGMPASIVALETEILESADLVITTSEALNDRVKEYRKGKSLVTIRNGVDSAFWEERTESPVEYRGIPAPRAIYVGALDEWFDFELLDQMARALPGVSFVVVGQRKREVTTTPPNIHYLGTRARPQVRALLQHAQVGLIPFKRNPLIECVCPLKLYEYMACGLPVLSTRWEELERMKSPARLMVAPEDWIYHIRQLTSGYQDHSGAKRGLKEYAQANDWKRRWADWQLQRTSPKAPADR